MSIPIIIECEHLGAIAVSLAREKKKQSEGATRSLHGLHGPLLFLSKQRAISQWKGAEDLCILVHGTANFVAVVSDKVF